MAEKEALDARELGEAALNAAAAAKPLTINDLPNDQLVSIFMAIGDQVMVRHTIPLVCKAWAELYRTEDASPLHETLELNLWEETKTAMAGMRWEWDSEDEEDMEEWWGNEEPWDDRGPPVHASRVISWAERRAGSVHHLRLTATCGRDLRDFHSKDLGALVAVVGSSLTEIRIDAGPNILRHESFWEAMRDSVLPAGRLRSFVFRGNFPDDSFGPNLEALDLGQLAGSLEELVMEVSYDFVAESFYELQLGLPRFPESVCALTALRRLVAIGRFSKIPAKISSLKKLDELKLSNSLSSLPKELGKLSRLEKLDLSGNEDLGEEPVDEAFPAALGKMKSLRELDLRYCGLSSLHQGLGELSRLTRLNLGHNNELGNALHAGEAFPAALGKMKSLRELDLSNCELRAVPTFVGELKSLEVLNLSWNEDLEIDSPLDFLVEGCPRLREVTMHLQQLWGSERWGPESRAHLKALEAKLRTKNPNAKVIY